MKPLEAVRRLGLALLGIVVLVGVLALVQAPMHFAHAPLALAAVVIIAAALAVYVAWVRFVERRIPAELSPRALAPEGLTGLALGIALFGAVIGVLALAGAYSARPYGGWGGAVPALLITLAGAVVEEIVFRGWLFRTVRTLAGTWPAVGLSALVFGALHAFNPGASPTSTIAVALEAGVLLALAYAATDRLWLPIGLHAGWNYAEGFLFGTPVSGHVPDSALLYGQLHGPVALTGGTFGPEASLVAIVVCLLASVPFAAYIVRRRAPRPTTEQLGDPEAAVVPS